MRPSFAARKHLGPWRSMAAHRHGGRQGAATTPANDRNRKGSSTGKYLRKRRALHRPKPERCTEPERCTAGTSDYVLGQASPSPTKCCGERKGTHSSRDGSSPLSRIFTATACGGTPTRSILKYTARVGSVLQGTASAGKTWGQAEMRQPKTRRGHATAGFRRNLKTKYAAIFGSGYRRHRTRRRAVKHDALPHPTAAGRPTVPPGPT